jgi:GNAT superfamily N-acetyltransferase
MSLRAALFTDEYESLGALTGQSRDELIAEQGNHDGRDWWLAWDGNRVVGLMQPWLRPDNKQALFFGPCAPGAYALFAAQIPGAVVTVLDTAEQVPLDELADAGFTTMRFEDRYSIPVRPLDAPIPPGLRIISAADTELKLLMALDCALREDVPGSAGWQPDATWFREETYDSPYFDPSTYLVALDGEKYVGLVRIWNGPQPLPRLGLIGLLPAYRRRGLAKALISRAFTALLASLGGVVTGSDVELSRD